MGSPAAAAPTLDERSRTLTAASGRWTQACLLAIAATGLGAAIQVRDGLYDPRGYIGLTIALVAGALVFLLPRTDPPEPLARSAARWVFAAAIAFNLYQL